MDKSNYKILVVDDEEDIRDLLVHLLEKEGFQTKVSSNGNEGLKIALNWLPHLILLDVMMPEMDGIETCREIRNKKEIKNTIIAFLTARNEDYSQIAGFDSGADDYISKPVKPRVLISRINALLRRYENQPEENSAKEIELGELKINRDKFLVYKNNTPIQLPRKEFELLDLLVSKPGNVFTRSHILDSVWGEDVVVGDRTIDVHIRKLREKLGDNYFKTIKGIGYKFEVPIE
ncbi:MAG: response regulator transcription factor [Bacteroidota bacterium]|jgi:two-component system alkaline phosphatase synthesis response regulator PhoP